MLAGEIDSVYIWVYSYTACVRIAIDVREACRERLTGKGRFTRCFVTELLSREGHTFLLYSDTDLYPTEWKPFKDRFEYRVVPTRGLLWHVRIAALLMQELSLDLYLSPVSYLVPWMVGSTVPTALIVHDLIALMDEPHQKKAMFIERLTLPRALRTAKMVCAISAITAADLRTKFPFVDEKKLTTIYAGHAQYVQSTSPAPDASSILCVATLCPRKNQLRLIEAFSKLPEELQAAHPLVLVGARGWEDEAIVQKAASCPHVEWKSYVPDAELEELYSKALLLAYPSTYEGFGLPILEGFSRSIPVLTANIGSMKEVAEDAACLINPLDVDSIKDGLQNMLSDEDYRNALVEKGQKRLQEFSWHKTVNYFLDAAKNIL